MKKTLYTYILTLLCALALPLGAMGQSASWSYIHKGNKLFERHQYQAAGAYYNKALKINPNNPRALYNLANVRMAQSAQAKDAKSMVANDSIAMMLYDKAIRFEKSKLIKSMAYHNKGVILQREAGMTGGFEKQKLLRAAIDQYKNALRLNPNSESSRYNLVLCQKQLKKGGNGGGGSKNKSNEKKQQQQQQKQNQQPLLNYTRQAEQQTRQKMNQNRHQRALDKNW